MYASELRSALQMIYARLGGKMVHSFLLIGQSNMAGRGFPEDVAPIENKNIKVMRNGLWREFYVPVNPDRKTSGISLAESFADLYQKDHGVTVGLIPCADGGTQLSQWAEGEPLFENACFMAQMALRDSEIAGILWHQGECDCRDELYLVYEEKLERMMTALRKRLGLNDVPLLLGGLGDYLHHNDSWGRDNYKIVNNALKSYAQRTPATGFVSAEGLTSNPDLLHFDAKSLREFGVRYYEEFKKLENKNRVFEDKSQRGNKIVTRIENL